MINRIRLSLIYVSVIAALFAVYFTTQVFESEMTTQLKSYLRESFRLIESAYDNGDVELSKFANDSLRITLVNSDGTVLFESDAESAKMGNHKSRPEIVDAMRNGSGENLRYSITLNAKIFYYANRLKDGNILRLGRRQANLQQTFSKTTPYLLALLAAIVLASILIAIGLSKAFVKPLQKLADNLGSPELMNDESVYKEIAPLVKTIQKQNRELQVTVEQLSDEKKKTSRLKDEFTANASHELKTPLTSISGYAELIENGIAKPEDVKIFASKIHKEANRLMNIANDIMTLSKLDEPGGTILDLNEDIELWKIASNCLDELSLNAGKKNIRLTLDGNPAAGIKGNSKLLFEMTYNLVDNAIRYTEQGGNVNIIVEPCAITVKDSGIGIPEESLSRVFERFYRVDKSRSKETGGTGLGLAIVKHIADVHHAKIQIKSIVGVGTEIKVEF